MKKKRRSAKHLMLLALAWALLVGAPIPPGFTQNRAAKPPTRASAAHQQGSNDSRKSDTSRSKTIQAQSDDTAAPAPEPPGKIAFASDRDGNFEIYVMNPDGGGLVRLTNNPAEDTQPTWSPDGTRLAFVSNRDGNKEIYVVNADGSGTTRVTNNAAEDFDPAWSPSTTTPQIAFVTHRDGNDEVYVMNPDGTGLINLTQNTADDVNPSWAPSATLLAFASNRDGDKFEIYRMTSTGTTQTRLTNNSFNDVATTWPSGRITFQSDRDGNDEIYTMNVDGTSQTRVTNNAAFDLDPARAPDGARIAFVSNRDGAANLEIYAANSDGSSVVRLTNNPASDIDPAIQPLPPAATQGTVQLNATAYIIGEGQRGVDITVTRTGGSGVAFVTIATVGGTATERTDFIPIFRQLTFGVGETSKTVNIPVIDDFRVEGDEMFTVTLSGPVNTALGTPNTATVTITDNDSGVSSLAATIFGVTAAGNLVRFSSATPGTLDVNVAITGLQSGETILGLDTRPASLGVDARPASRQLYALGSTGRIYRLNPVTGAATLVSTLTGATLTGTAFGVDFNPVPDRLRVVSDADQNLRINVDNGTATVDTTLAYATGDPNAGQNPNVVGVAYTNNFAGAATVTLYGIDSNLDTLVRQGSATGSPVSPNTGQLFTIGPLGVNTTDVVGFDIANPSGVAFAALAVGGTSQLYTINLTTGAATLLGSIGGTSAIRGITATSPPANPIDDIGFFVRQQYLDFLSREPEASGFNAWFNVLANCSDLFNAPGCDRVTVSSSFFGSPEFQLRGTFAMRFYLAALNRLPTYREFVRDMSALGGATDAEVLANRARFPDDFVQRDEFRMIFDTLSNAAYVDRLIANTGVSFANRNQLVADLDAGTKTRAQVLREIVDSLQFVQAAYNRTFVLAEYFGYLGRDPDAAGFNAWVTFLNANPNDFRTMVRGFLDSMEYRARFGPP